MITLSIKNYFGDSYEFAFPGTSGGVMSAFQGTIERKTLETITVPFRKAASTSGVSLGDFRAAGGMIFSQLPDDVQDYLHSNPLSPLLIQTNDIAVPWELFHDGQEFQVLSRPIGRIIMLPVRIAMKGCTVEQIAKPSVLIIANPGRDSPQMDLPEADDEAIALSDFFQQEGCRVNILAGKAVTRFDVMAHLQAAHGAYDIIHYAGHAVMEKVEGKSFASLLLADGPLNSEEIRRSLRGSPIVFLNACHTVHSENSRPDSKASSYAMGSHNALDLAQAFSLGNRYGSARAVIGTLFRNNDTRSREMALSYYQSLLAETSIGESLRTARQQIFTPTDVTWASYILYGDPRLQLITANRKSALVLKASSLQAATSFERAVSVNDPGYEQPKSEQGNEPGAADDDAADDSTLSIELFGDTAIKALFNALQETGGSSCKMLITTHLFLGMTALEDGYTRAFLQSQVKDLELTITEMRNFSALLNEALDSSGVSERIQNILELAQGYVKLDPDQPGVIEEKHLLQGFFEDGGGLTAKKLAELGVQMPLPDSSAILSMPLFTKPKETNQVDGRHKHNIRSLMDALAPSGRQVINKAFAEVRSLGHSVLTTPHLFIAVLQVDREGMRKAVREAGFEPTELERNLQSIIKPGGTQGPKEEIVVTSRFYRILEMAAEMAPHIEARHIGMAILQEGAEDINSITIQVLQQCRLNPARLLALLQPVSTAQDTGGATRTATPILDSIGKDLTRLAQNGKLGTLVGRSEEIDVLSEILLRKSKGCPVLIGEAGVGKTAIVEGFARRIHEGRMPPSLSRMRVVELATNDLVAGTKYRGDFEERMQGLIAEVIRAGDIILFLDEIHTLIGAREGGSANAGDILKPALARGDIKCIGATTIEEYRRWIESDAALERRFTPVMIGEPTPEETIRILDGIRPSYEAHHGVVIPAASIEAAIKLSCEGMPQRRLPDKAIDLLDQACARVRRLQRPEDNVGGGQPEVTVQFIREVLSVLSGVPTPVCLSVESGIHSERLADLESVLADRIIGQPEAIVALVQAVSLSEAGMRETNRPRGVFLFTGPAGVGKSSLAKAFAEENGRHLIQIDMAEYTEKHQMAKLIGAPAGYIGHGREGYLTGKLKSHPHCVLLLDEMDKAHPDVSRLFIHLFEEGRITDAMGRTVDARQALIIMTANIGAESALSGSGHGIGFLPSSQRTSSSQIEGLLRQSFSREFIDRIDQVIAFRHLNRQDIVNIARRLLDAVWVRFAEQHNIQIKEDEGLLDFICEKGFTKESGVRPLKRIIEEYVVAQLSRMLIEGTAAGKEQLVATVSEGEIVFNAG